MSTATVDIASSGPATRCIRERQEIMLAVDTQELASLRFAIILTARWESSETEDAERRKELRDELGQLRAHYFDKIDRIAMTFGVEQAMKAKEEVERTVEVPKGMMRPDPESENGGLYF